MVGLYFVVYRATPLDTSPAKQNACIIDKSDQIRILIIEISGRDINKRRNGREGQMIRCRSVSWSCQNTESSRPPQFQTYKAVIGYYPMIVQFARSVFAWYSVNASCLPVARGPSII